MTHIRKAPRQVVPQYPMAYIAGGYSERERLLGYAKQLVQLRVLIRSAWLSGMHSEDTPFDVSASHDLRDIQSCDCVIVFGSPLDTTQGGKHWESGFALAHNIPVLIVGSEATVFNSLCHYRWADIPPMDVIAAYIHEHFQDGEK